MGKHHLSGAFENPVGVEMCNMLSFEVIFMCCIADLCLEKRGRGCFVGESDSRSA